MPDYDYITTTGTAGLATPTIHTTTAWTAYTPNTVYAPGFVTETQLRYEIDNLAKKLYEIIKASGKFDITEEDFMKVIEGD